MLCFTYAVDIDNSRLEIMCHAAEALRADELYVGIMRLVLRELPVNEALSDVVDDTVLKSAMNLHPPRIFPSPHAYTLSVPRLILAMGIPSSEVHVVHTTIVERRPLGLMALTRSQAGSHMANAHNR